MTERFEPNGIIQLGPSTRVPGGLAVINEVRDWGVIAYMQLSGPMPGVVITTHDNRAWFRLAWDDIRATGGRVE